MTCFRENWSFLYKKKSSLKSGFSSGLNPRSCCFLGLRKKIQIQNFSKIPNCAKIKTFEMTFYHFRHFSTIQLLVENMINSQFKSFNFGTIANSKKFRISNFFPTISFEENWAFLYKKKFIEIRV